MNQRERGFLLLTSFLGNPQRRPIGPATVRKLARRISALPQEHADAAVAPEHLTAMGFERKMAERIVSLLDDELLLDYYLKHGMDVGCVPVARPNPQYPPVLLRKLGQDAPGCLWTKGDRGLLIGPKVAVVGSRVLSEDNARFAEEAGRQAAEQGFTLVSGNAPGADSAAQKACLAAGGKVISVVADELQNHPETENVLYISENDFDAPFSPQRAISRNRVIHALGAVTLAAQCALGKGGTWDGSVKNLRYGWSTLCVFDDGAPGAQELTQMGALPVSFQDLENLGRLPNYQKSLFDLAQNSLSP